MIAETAVAQATSGRLVTGHPLAGRVVTTSVARGSTISIATALCQSARDMTSRSSHVTPTGPRIRMVVEDRSRQASV
ncbi:hypothetical protein PG996_006354 [Apiospora saccharicola]|uniref:Uncharacterized protein n=1 Tax=Apiospora saccharicola TaxID=335842 RepID=A0ABR1VP33_9PEZI